MNWNMEKGTGISMSCGISYTIKLAVVLYVFGNEEFLTISLVLHFRKQVGQPKGCK